ncbi:hypothetical protein ZWY2020_046342 [Hordeum vulgare]|nr:hypothetical protein ZWY2020_046342 [Hordeum vulgare]
MEAIVCFVALSTLFYIWFLKLVAGRSNSQRKPQLPPGPWTLPIIGSLHHVVSVLQHRTITDLCRRHGPLMLLKLGELPAVVVSSAEAAAQVMKTNDAVFSNRRTTGLQDIVGFGGQGIIFAPYGDHWRQMRKVCVMELLSPRQVRRMEGIRAEQVGGLVRSIASSAGATTINVSQEVAALSNGIVTRAVFGGNFVRQEEYLRRVDEIMNLMGGFCLVDLFPSSWLVRRLSNGERQMKRSCASILRIIDEIINNRKEMRAAGGNDGACSKEDEDLLDVLLRLQHEDSLAFPLTTEMIATVLFVGIFFHSVDLNLLV